MQSDGLNYLSMSERYLDLVEQNLDIRIRRPIEKEIRRIARRGKIGTVPTLRLNETQLLQMELELWENLREFWAKHCNSAIQAIRDYDGLKTIYLRPDLYRPPFFMSVLSRSVLYADKVIVVDPVRYVELANFNGHLALGRKFFPSDAIGLMALREWIEEGLVEIIPQPELWNEETRRTLIGLIDNDAIQIAEETKIVGKINGAITRRVDDAEAQSGRILTGYRLSSKLNSVLFAGEATQSYPTTDWGEDLDYWQWKLEKEKRALGLDTKLLFALNRFPLNWFKAIPSDLLLELRRKEVLAGMRTELRRCFSDLSGARSEDLEDVAKRCNESLDVEIHRVQDEWKGIKRIVSGRVASGATAAIVAGTLTSLISTAVSIPALYSALIVGTISGGITTASLSVNEIPAIMEKRRRLRGNPLYFLFKIKEKALEHPNQLLVPRSGVSPGYLVELPQTYEESKQKFEEAYLGHLRSLIHAPS